MTVLPEEILNSQKNSPDNNTVLMNNAGFSTVLSQGNVITDKPVKFCGALVVMDVALPTVSQLLKVRNASTQPGVSLMGGATKAVANHTDSDQTLLTVVGVLGVRGVIALERVVVELARPHDRAIIQNQETAENIVLANVDDTTRAILRHATARR